MKKESNGVEKATNILMNLVRWYVHTARNNGQPTMGELTKYKRTDLPPTFGKKGPFIDT